MNSGIQAEIGGLIRATRKAKGMTATALANAVGVSGATMSAWESGGQAISAASLIGLARVLGVPVGVLVGEPQFDEVEEVAEPTDDARAVGERLRQCREERRLSQAELAALVGCSESLVSRWETGQRALKTRQLMRVMNALGITLARLWGAHDWVSELRVPPDWPTGLREFLCSEYASSETPIRPSQVPLLAGMALHPRWRGTTTVNDWRHAAIMLLVELGDP